MKNIIFLIVIILGVSCNTSHSKKTSAPLEQDKQLKEENVEEFRLKTKTGKEFVVKEEKPSASLSTITVIPKGFKFTKDSVVIKEADPVSNVFTADINDDGFDELYIVTTSAGSGSYATIYAFSSNKDKSVTPVYQPELPEKEREKVFKGYMGHDSIYVSDDHLYRKFPVYKEGDANCCPSGGTKIIEYVLKQGEASWILEIKKD